MLNRQVDLHMCKYLDVLPEYAKQTNRSTHVKISRMSTMKMIEKLSLAYVNMFKITYLKQLNTTTPNFYMELL